MAATMSPLSAVGCWRTTTQSPSVIAASTIESPLTWSRNSWPSPTSWRGSGNTSSTTWSARIGPPAAIRPTTGAGGGEGWAVRSPGGRGRGPAGQRPLDGAGPVGVTAQVAPALQRRELVGDAAGARQPDRLADLAH